jgi:tryptophan synthase alpha chain
MPLHFNKKPALVAYVTCGDPNLPTTRDIVLAAIDAGADVIELGVPFSDPVADGPVIQRASQRAIRQGTTLKQVLQLAADVRKQSEAGLIIFSYLNPVMRMGVSDFGAGARDAGVDGVLLTDLPVEEAGKHVREMRQKNLDTIFLAAPTSTDERLREISRLSTGFVYAVSRTGITGTQTQLADDAEALVRRLQRYTKLPIAVGFGISTPEQFAGVGEFANAAVVGSAIVETIERNPGKEAESVAKFIKQLSAVSHQLSVTSGKS